jgi:hypothetical protein
MWDDLAGEVVQQLAAARLWIGTSGYGFNEFMNARGELGPQVGMVRFGRLRDVAGPRCAHDRFPLSHPTGVGALGDRRSTASRVAVSTVDVVTTKLASC